jgi:hypothetical protein
MLILNNGACRVERREVPYDDAELVRGFEQRRVPDRHFIGRAFFGGRLPLTAT